MVLTSLFSYHKGYVVLEIGKNVKIRSSENCKKTYADTCSLQSTQSVWYAKRNRSLPGVNLTLVKPLTDKSRVFCNKE
jgi:hypothetical protein